MPALLKPPFGWVIPCPLGCRVYYRVGFRVQVHASISKPASSVVALRRVLLVSVMDRHAACSCSFSRTIAFLQWETLSTLH